MLVAAFMQYSWHLVNVIEGANMPPISIGYTAWIARGFLELRVLLQYVLQSEENGSRFMSDALNDGVESVRAFLSPATRHPELAGLAEEGRKCIADALKTAPRTGAAAAHLNTGRIAADLGIGEYFRLLNKLLSKLLHPTALSVFVTQMPEKWQPILDSILKNALEEASSFLTRIEEYRATNRTLPPTES
jgi:hypothetical protein